MIIIETKFELGQEVYLITDKEQDVRIITGIQISANGGILYRTVCGSNEYWAYDMELSPTIKNLNSKFS